MLTIHLGPHKTGTSFIQRRMVDNRPLFGDDFQTVVSQDLPLHALIEAIHPVRNRDGAQMAVDTIAERSYLLAQIYADCENTLVSSEDLFGRLPTRMEISGLYPFADIFLGAIVAGLQQAGGDFQFVFYHREYRDWLKSVYRYKFRKTPDRAFAPRRFKEKHLLPNDWNECLVNMRDAVGRENFHVVSYEQDRATGNLGRALFDLAGLPRDIQANFRPLKPLNVSQPETVDPARWK